MGLLSNLLHTIGMTNSTNSKFIEDADEATLTTPKEGINSYAQIMTKVVSSNFTSRKAAVQFVLEELDAAQKGKAIEKKFVTDSGVEYDRYNHSTTNFNQKNRLILKQVDNACMQLFDLIGSLGSPKSVKIRLRLATVDKIMEKYHIGKYHTKEIR